MPGCLPVGYKDRDDCPHVVAPVAHHTCVECAAGPPCAGACSRRVCNLHAYQCSRCDGVLCEACWTRHEVGGRHVSASPAEVQAAQRRTGKWPSPRNVHRRAGRFPKTNTEAQHG